MFFFLQEFRQINPIFDETPAFDHQQNGCYLTFFLKNSDIVHFSQYIHQIIAGRSLNSWIGAFEFPKWSNLGYNSER